MRTYTFRSAIPFFALLASIALTPCISIAQSSPHVDWVFPAAGAPAGAVATILGYNFGENQGSGTVTVNGLPASVTAWGDTYIGVAIPQSATTGPVVVTVDGSASNAFTYAVIPLPTITSLSPASGPVNSSTNLTITGTGFGPNSFGHSVTFDHMNVEIVSWTDTQIVVREPAYDSASGPVPVQVSFWSDRWSATANFNLLSLHVTATFPTWGPIGGHIRLVGLGFGETQGSSTVSFNGIPATVVGWNESNVTAEVPVGATTGPVTVTVEGYTSNSVNFTVAPPPTITSLSPASGILTSSSTLTINGSGFGPSSFAAYVTIAGAYATINSWSDTSITVTSPGYYSMPGPIPVLVSIGGEAFSTNTAFFQVGNSPNITQLTPTTGPVGTPISLTGSNFGSTQGNGQVLVGGVPATITSWADGAIMAAIPDGVTTGQEIPVTVVTSGGTSNEIGFTADEPVSGVVLTPDKAIMVVGETRTFRAGDAYGSTYTGLTWSVSDPTKLELSTDDPPVVKALAPGEVILTANDARATITVYPDAAIPPGTVKWSVSGDGSGVTQILPAVPSSGGVADVFAAQNSGSVMAITADGTAAWTTYGATAPWLLPDFQGGLVIGYGNQVQKVDGVTGELYPAFSVSPDPSDPSTYIGGVAVHTDGTIFAITGNALVGIDPKTGQPKFTVPMERSSSNFPFAGKTDYPAIPISDLIVAGDGNAYVAYMYKVATYSSDAHNHIDAYLKVLRVSPSGESEKVEVKKLSQDHTRGSVQLPNLPYGIYYCDAVCAAYPGGAWMCARNPTGCLGSVEVCELLDGCAQWQFTDSLIGLLPPDITWPDINGAYLITNADKGVVLSFRVFHEGFQTIDSTAVHPCVPNCRGTYSHSDGSTVDYLATIFSDGRVETASVPVVEGEGTLKAVLQREDGSYIGTRGTSNGNILVAFDTSGAEKWRAAGDYKPLIATADGGVIARKTTSGGVFRVTFGANGTPISQVADDRRVQAWTGNTYRYGSVDQIEATPASLTPSFVASVVQYHGTAAKHYVTPNEGLAILAHTDLRANPVCDTVMGRFADFGHVSKDVLISQIHATADGASRYVFDGPSSDEDLDQARFPDVASPSMQKIRQWFDVGNGRQALSQVNGYAIWFRLNEWHGWLNITATPYHHSNGKLTHYGMGTLFHEVLHKRSVGDGFTHCNMDNIFDVACDHYQTEINLESELVGRSCFADLN